MVEISSAACCLPNFQTSYFPLITHANLMQFFLFCCYLDRPRPHLWVPGGCWMPSEKVSLGRRWDAGLLQLCHKQPLMQPQHPLVATGYHGETQQMFLYRDENRWNDAQDTVDAKHALRGHFFFFFYTCCGHNFLTKIQWLFKTVGKTSPKHRLRRRRMDWVRRSNKANNMPCKHTTKVHMHLSDTK